MTQIYRHAVAAAAVIALLGVSTPSSTQQRFKNPEEATQALVAAAQSSDLKRIIAVLGPDGRDIVSSGDRAADEEARSEFLAKYDTSHRIETKDDSNAVLLIGQLEWPFPIPLVRKNNDWFFDTAAGREEILARRIGRNELDAIQACLAYVDAQNEYAERNSEGTGAYAQRILSRPGKRDGLFWRKTEGEPVSPLGEAVVMASAEGYRLGQGRTPYHGYFFSILARQGRNAPGGAHNYVVNGRMIGGFALVAYPAEYLNSGMMTFIVNHVGNVYQKDLGLRTAQIAGQMSSFDPDPTWKKVDVALASP